MNSEADRPFPPPSLDLRAAAPFAAPMRSLRPCHILLVEDHADTAALMRRLLARRGYEVTVATTVGEALDAARAHPFDLMIVDLALPDGSGLDFMRALAGRPERPPAIAVSGFGMPDDAAQSLAAGFIDHLAKPVAVERLWAVIDGALGSCAAPSDN